jgi:hypothetical protein
VCLRVFRDPPTPLTDARPDVPPGLTAVIARCLEKDPSRRWPDVASFVAALAPFAEARPAPLPVPVPAPAPVTVREPSYPPVQTVAPPAATMAPAPAAATILASSSPVPAPSPPAPPRRSRVLEATAAVLALGLPLAVFFGLRERGNGLATQTTPRPASVVDEPAPDASVVPALASASVAVPPVASAVLVPHTDEPAASAAPSARLGRPRAAAPISRPTPVFERPIVAPPATPPPAAGPWQGSRQ